MKKIFTLFLLIISFSLSACTNNSQETSLEDNSPSTNQETITPESIIEDIVNKEEKKNDKEGSEDDVETETEEEGLDELNRFENGQEEEVLKEDDRRSSGASYVQVTEPSFTEFSGKRLEIKGTTGAETSIIKVSFKNEQAGLEDIFTLTQFKQGDTNWRYVADTRYQNLAEGNNQYTIEAFQKVKLKNEESQFIEKLLGKQIININASIPNDVLDIEDGSTITIKKLPERETLDTKGFLKKIGTLDQIEKQNDQVGYVHQLSEIEINKVSSITSGRYKDGTLYIITVSCLGPCPPDKISMVKDTNNQMIILEKHTSSFSRNISIVFRASIDKKTTISNLFPPEKIKIPNSNYSLIREQVPPGGLTIGFSYLFFDELSLKKLFDHEKLGKTFYLDPKTDCIIAENENNTYSRYYLELPYLTHFDQKNQANNYFTTPDITTGKVNIKLNDNQDFEGFFTVAGVGGCGVVNCYKVLTTKHNALFAKGVSKDLKVNELRSIGKTDTGEEVFIERYKESELQNPSEDSFLYSVFQLGTHNSDIKDMKSFYNLYPVVYIKDPFDRMVVHTQKRFIPAVECGKPVIYLYPEVTTDINVKVTPNGGFSVTIPEYPEEKGWSVKATPDSEIFNYDDSQTYPYLFWEGRGYNYERPQEGFVLKKEEVESFLREKLTFMGMIETEINDFLEFWHPRMQKDPYYFITFLPQYQFDYMAPLEVTPQPDTIIRVFMDYEGLKSFKEVPKQVLHPRERKGYTVVEWGGALNGAAN